MDREIGPLGIFPVFLLVSGGIAFGAELDILILLSLIYRYFGKSPAFVIEPRVLVDAGAALWKEVLFTRYAFMFDI